MTDILEAIERKESLLVNVVALTVLFEPVQIFFRDHYQIFTISTMKESTFTSR